MLTAGQSYNKLHLGPRGAGHFIDTASTFRFSYLAWLRASTKQTKSRRRVPSNVVLDANQAPHFLLNPTFVVEPPPDSERLDAAALGSAGLSQAVRGESTVRDLRIRVAPIYTSKIYTLAPLPP